MNHIRLNIYHIKILLILSIVVLFISAGCSTEDNTSESSNIYTGLASSGTDILIDGSGNAVVTGFAFGDVSTDSGSGEADVFLARHDTSGDDLSFDQVGSSGEDFAQSLVELGGNVYVAGYTYGDLSADAEPGSTDVFLMQFNSSGAWQWTKRYGTTGNDYCWDVTSDGTNLFLVGNTDKVFPGVVDVTNEYGNDIFLLKLSTSGNQLAVTQLGKDTAININSYSQSYGVTVAYDGTNIVIGGITNDTLGASSIGDNDIVIAGYDTNLNNQLWITQLGTTYKDSITDMVAISAEIYFTGFSYGTPDATYDYTTAGYNEDHSYTEVFLYNYHSAGGDFGWVAQAGTATYDRGYALAINGTNLYVTGNTNGDLYGTNAGSYDFFILKYNTSGVFQWKRQFGSDVYDTADGIAIDASGDILIAGKTYGTLNSQSNDVSAFSAFVSKYDDDTTGDHLWTKVY